MKNRIFINLLIIIFLQSSLYSMENAIPASSAEETQFVLPPGMTMKQAMELWKFVVENHDTIYICSTSASAIDQRLTRLENNNNFLGSLMNQAVPTLAVIGGGLAISAVHYGAKLLYKKYISKSDSLHDIQKKLQLSQLQSQVRNHQQNAFDKDLEHLGTFLSYIQQCPDKKMQAELLKKFKTPCDAFADNYTEYLQSIKYIPLHSTQNLVATQNLIDAGIYTQDEEDDDYDEDYEEDEQ